LEVSLLYSFLRFTLLLCAIYVPISYVIFILWILLLWSYWSSLNCWILPAVLVSCNRQSLIFTLIKCWNRWMTKHCSVHVLVRRWKSLSGRHLLQLQTLNCCDWSIEGRWPLIVFIQHTGVLWAQNFAIADFTADVWLRHNHAVQLVRARCLTVVSMRLQTRYLCRLLVTVSTRWVFCSHGLVHKLLLSICCRKREIKSLCLLALSTTGKVSRGIILARTHLMLEPWALLFTYLPLMWIVYHSCVVGCLIELWIAHCFLSLDHMLFDVKIIYLVHSRSLHWTVAWWYHRKLFQTASVPCVLKILPILGMACWVI